MREIDNSGSEIFPMDEEVKGGKNHKKIVAGSLLAPVLAVAAAGLITLAAVAEMAENGSGSVWDSLPPPPVEEVLPPEEPVIPPEEPVIPPEEPVIPPEEPEKKPEEPTNPPPTTPPPTTPPPTTPPPTTPPPTTPPPTTPPPFVPIYDPDPEPVVPSFVEPSIRFSAGFKNDYSDFSTILFNYNIDMGSADGLRVNLKTISENGDMAVVDRQFAETSSGYKENSFFLTDYGALGPASTVTADVSAEYYYNGQWTTLGSYTVPVPYAG